MNILKVLLVVIAISTCEVRAADIPPTVWGADEVLQRRHVPASSRGRYLAAATFLRERLVAAHAYSHIQKRCLAFEFEDVKGEVFYFAAKADQSICGPPSESNLLDRYQVNMKRKRIYIYDTRNDSYILVRNKKRPESRPLTRDKRNE